MRAERIERLGLSRKKEVSTSRFSGSDVPGNADFSAFRIEPHHAAQCRRHELKTPAAPVHGHATMKGVARKLNLARNFWPCLVDAEWRSCNDDPVEIVECRAAREALAISDVERNEF